MPAKRMTVITKLMVILGSLLYLYVAFSWLYAYLSYASNPILLMGPGGVWTPVVAAVGVISALMLFVQALVSYSGRQNRGADISMRRSIYWGGIALFVVAAGSGYMWLVILGFMLAYVGKGFDTWM